jgi:hypothetical protein
MFYVMMYGGNKIHTDYVVIPYNDIFIITYTKIFKGEKEYG